MRLWPRRKPGAHSFPEVGLPAGYEPPSAGLHPAPPVPVTDPAAPICDADDGTPSLMIKSASDVDELQRLLTEWETDLAARHVRARIFHDKGDQFAFQQECVRIQMLTEHVAALTYAISCLG